METVWKRSIVERFEKEFSALGGEAYVVESTAKAREKLRELITRDSPKKVAISDSELGKRLQVDEVLNEIGVTPVSISSGSNLRKALSESDVGITGVSLALADTGTLVIKTDNEFDRLVSALPYTHIALLSNRQILETADSAINKLSELCMGTSKGATGVVSFITGTSRTADIEQVLVKGVHGPNKLCAIVLVENWEAEN